MNLCVHRRNLWIGLLPVLLLGLRAAEPPKRSCKCDGITAARACKTCEWCAYCGKRGPKGATPRPGNSATCPACVKGRKG